MGWWFEGIQNFGSAGPVTGVMWSVMVAGDRVPRTWQGTQNGLRTRKALE